MGLSKKNGQALGKPVNDQSIRPQTLVSKLEWKKRLQKTYSAKLGSSRGVLNVERGGPTNGKGGGSTVNVAQPKAGQCEGFEDVKGGLEKELLETDTREGKNSKRRKSRRECRGASWGGLKTFEGVQGGRITIEQESTGPIIWGQGPIAF